MCKAIWLVVNLTDRINPKSTITLRICMEENMLSILSYEISGEKKLVGTGQMASAITSVSTPTFHPCIVFHSLLFHFLSNFIFLANNLVS